MFLSLKGHYESLKLFDLSGVFERGTMNIFTKISNRVPSLQQKLHLCQLLMHYILTQKVLEKSDQTRTSALVN